VDAALLLTLVFSGSVAANSSPFIARNSGAVRF
jgi:hypothetical protein